MKLFEKNITISLQDSRFTQFQSWASYAASFIPTILTSTPVGNMTNAQVIELGNQALNTTNSLLDFTGYNRTNMYQIAEMTGSIPSQNKPVVTTNSETLTSRPLTEYQQKIEDDHQKNLEKLTTQANNIISQYYTPSMQENLHIFMEKNQPTIDPIVGTITNVPSVEKVIQSALEKPNQETYNALQSTLEATEVAIFANKNGDSRLKAQLKAYETNLKITLQDPKIAQFSSWKTQATNYLQQFLPDTKTILDTTGLGNTTTSDAIKFGQSALSVADTALYLTGQKNTPIRETLGYS
jgi:hypothetical protein